MKLIIAGSRTLPSTYRQKSRMAEDVEEVITELSVNEIVCGCAAGADLFGAEFGRDWNIPVTEMPANWKQEGRAAGMKRNIRMAAYADACIVFWDGKSRGAQNMIKEAMTHGLKLFVFTLEAK